MDYNVSSPSVLESELYFLIARFLSDGPCKRTAEVFLKELEEFKLLPSRVDWEGNEHFRSFQSLVYLNRHIRSNHLLRIVERVETLLDKEVKPSVPGVRSLLGAGSHSLLRTAEGLKHTKWTLSHHIVKHNGALLYPPKNLSAPAVPHVLLAYQMAGAVRQQSVVPTSLFSKIGMHGRKLGHLSAVYCVLFDRTGNHIFTGADDALVKIWNKYDMRLVATLRGHAAEITDMAVSYENTYLASVSCDKTVRVWCLRSKAPAAVLHGHSSMITSVQFCPKIQGDHRYLVSTGNDGCVCFWHYDVSSSIFNPKPIKFIEKSRAGAQMLCSSFSPGGAFLATGNSDHVVRVYFLHLAGPEKICELEAHTDKVDSICYSNNLNRFVSGSNDGTARIWRFEKHEWRATVLNMSEKLNSSSPGHFELRGSGRAENQIRVTMVSWSVDDTKVITAASDLTIKIWNSYSGALLKILEGHEDEVYVLETSPMDPRILLSAGHDGKMIVWDIVTATKIKKFFNMIEGQGHGAVFDCKFSPDGHSLAATDSHGHLLLLGFGSNDRCKKLPQQLFFHTDYRPLMRDANNFVLDEQTQQPPHLMPPPFLVDIDGNPYPPSTQRLVPGREHCSESSLIPYMVVNADGDSEVIGDRESHEGRANVPANQTDSSDTEVEVEDVSGAENSQPGQLRAARPSIDVMIQELQRQQDQRLGVDTGSSSSSGASTSHQGNSQVLSPPPLASPPTPRSHMQNRIGMRRSGEIEGVRQSLGNVSVRLTKKERAALKRQVTVRPLDIEALKISEERRSALSEEEVRKFLSERKKKLLSPHEPATTAVANKNRRQKKNTLSQFGVTENEGSARNRLTTRALYDTEEEEDEGGGSDLEFLGSESNSSDDYSDWVGDQGSSNLEPPKRRSMRKRKRRQLSSEEDESEDTDEQTTSSDEESSDDGEKEETPVDKPKREPKRRAASKKPGPKGKNKSNKKKKPSRPLLPSSSDPSKPELDDMKTPPEWITTVIPRKAPFVPQMGDEVIYFCQGHEQYLQAVVKKKVYEVSLGKNQPWHKIPHLKAHELVKIVGIKWLLKPTRLCCLKMAFIDTNSGKLTGKSFTIKYHDMPDVIDFLVLKQHYDISVDRNWKLGMRFRSMIDDQWWMGVIESQEPLSEEFPDSLYQSFNVHWDNGEYEKLSPWDMEPVDPKRNPSVVGGGVDVTQAEYKVLLYEPKKTEWPSCGREVESLRLIRGIEMLMTHACCAQPFSTPVNLQQFPTYACFVPYPIDLSTIRARLENGFYRRVTALQWDIRLICANASIFNQSGSVIVKNANAVTETLLRFIKDHNCQDPIPLMMELASVGVQTGSSGEDSNEGSSRPRKMTKADRSKKKRTKSRPKVNPNAWLEQSESLLAMLFECEDSEPFRVPVDPSQYPDYEDIVTNPMDLTTVHTKLATSHYDNPVDMCKDIRLIFSNSKLYNTNKRSRIYSMTLRLSALFEDQISHIISQWKSSVRISNRVNGPKKLPRSKQSSSLLPSSSWDTPIANVPGTNQPSTSGLSYTQDNLNMMPGTSQMVNGHASGVSTAGAIVSWQEDSDATIVEGEDVSSDGGHTEVCEEETAYLHPAGHDSDVDDDDEDDGATEGDDGDNDYRPSSSFYKNHKREPKSSKVLSKGKRYKGKRAKSSRSVSTHSVNEKLKKSNIFYTSDGNNETGDSSASDESLRNRTAAPKLLHTRRLKSQHFEDGNSSDEEVPQTTKKLLSKKSFRSKMAHGSKNNYKKKYKRATKNSSHRKARGTRSSHKLEDSEEEMDEESPEKTASALKRSARSARQKKKCYNEGASDEPEDEDIEDTEVEDHHNNENSDSEDESSSEAANEDSEDELITNSLRNGLESSSKPKQSNLKSHRRTNHKTMRDDSDSDVVTPRKRPRLIASPPSISKKVSVMKTVPSSVKTKSSKDGKENSKKSGPKIQTRNRGHQRVTYLEDDFEEEEDGEEETSNDDSEKDSNSDDDVSPTVSSRGRVRKLTPRARASLKGH